MASEYAVGLDEIIGELEEIIGDDDDEDDLDEALAEIISGDDDDDDEDEDEDEDDDEIGARRRRRRRKKKAKVKKAAKLVKRMRAAKAIDPRAVAVRRATRGKRRRLLVPIPTTVIAAATTTEISILPQRLFKTKRVSIPSNVSDDFRLGDIKIGQSSQYGAAGAVPATCMSEVAVDSDVDFDSADIGNQILIEATNTDAVNPHTFEGVLFGTAVY
jgi:hypothetical protein